MYNSWICINAYLDFVSISIIDIICNWQVCTRFISLSYSYLEEIINVLYPYHIDNRLKQVLNGDGYGCWDWYMHIQWWMVLLRMMTIMIIIFNLDIECLKVKAYVQWCDNETINFQGSRFRIKDQKSKTTMTMSSSKLLYQCDNCWAPISLT